jgi:hypothetical protein
LCPLSLQFGSKAEALVRLGLLEKKNGPGLLCCSGGSDELEATLQDFKINMIEVASPELLDVVLQKIGEKAIAASPKSLTYDQFFAIPPA